MSLSFFGPGGSVERRWIVYAMLRDNVQYHLEGGTPKGAFPALHSLGGALATGTASVPALQLRGEVDRARALLQRPISDFAVSTRTRAVCMMIFPLPEVNGVELASKAGWTTPFPLEGASTLGDVFGSFVTELLQVTEGAGEGDVVTVEDC